MLSILIGGWVLVDSGKAQVLKKHHVPVYQYFPGYGYVAKVPDDLKIGAKPVPEELKISPLIYSGKLEDAIYDGKVRLIVSGYPGEDEYTLASALSSLGLYTEEFPTSIMPRFKVYVPPEDALRVSRRIASLSVVSKIEPDLRNYLFNKKTRWYVQTHVQGDSLVWAHGIDGSGEIGGVMDTGLDYYSCYFYDRDVINPGPTHRKVLDYMVLSSSADDFASCPGSHGTHVSATFLGYPDDSASSIFFDYKGMAYGAKIIFGDAGGPSCSSCNGVCYSSSIYNILTDFYTRGARVVNFSWGTIFNTYSSASYDIDAFMWNNPDALVVISAGNSSSADAHEDGTIGSPATAKNAVAVGATEPFDPSLLYHERRAYYSSQGPTYDGRIKPDVMIPGGGNSGFILSARNRTDRTYSCSLVGFAGTSMAAPAMAGAALLVRQYFREGWYPNGVRDSANGFIPQGSLIKASLIASAQALLYEPPPPNGEVGFGGINLSRVLYFADAPPQYNHRLFVVDDSVGLSAGDSALYDITLGCNGSMYTDYAKIVLAWTDAPGAYLQNDLDLVVEGADGKVYKGNIFDSTGVSVPNPSGRDYLNPVEVVYVAPAKRGTWRIKVIARALNNPNPSGKQPFSLVAVDAGPCGNADGLTVHEMPSEIASLPYSIEGGTISFLKDAKVYAVDGRLVGAFKAGQKLGVRAGVYFVKVEGRTYKAVVK